MKQENAEHFSDENVSKFTSADGDTEDSESEHLNNSKTFSQKDLHNVDEKTRIRTTTDLVSLLVFEASDIEGTEYQINH
jgi:hypothetical protein